MVAPPSCGSAGSKRRSAAGHRLFRRGHVLPLKTEQFFFDPARSGFQKASVHLYVTLLNLAESTGPNKEIVIRHKKEVGEAAMHAGAGLLGDGGAAADAVDASDPTGGSGGSGGGGGEVGELVEDFEERLNLRLQEKEAEAATVVDEVRFGEGGWKDRYYGAKLHAGKGDELATRRCAVTSSGATSRACAGCSCTTTRACRIGGGSTPSTSLRAVQQRPRRPRRVSREAASSSARRSSPSSS